MDRTEGPEGPRSTTTKKHRLKEKWTGQRDQRGPRSTTTKKHRLKGKWTGQRDQRDLEVQQQRSTG